MSEAYSLDLQEQIARINNQQEEARKFAAEQHKLAAEASKLDRDRFYAPWLAFAAMLGGVLGLATFVAHLFGR